MDRIKKVKILLVIFDLAYLPVIGYAVYWLFDWVKSIILGLTVNSEELVFGYFGIIAVPVMVGFILLGAFIHGALYKFIKGRRSSAPIKTTILLIICLVIIYLTAFTS